MKNNIKEAGKSHLKNIDHTPTLVSFMVSISLMDPPHRRQDGVYCNAILVLTFKKYKIPPHPICCSYTILESYWQLSTLKWIGQGSWYNSYVRILLFKRSWVRIPALDARWISFNYFLLMFFKDQK